MLHQMKLQSNPFEKIKNRVKTLEICLNDEKRQLVQVGDDIEFILASDPSQKILVRVESLHHFHSFKDIYDTFDHNEYGAVSKKEYEEMYKYYSKEDELKYGVLGIKIKIYN